MDMMPFVDTQHTEQHKPIAPARARLKLLVLEADEQTLDRILDAIRFVCGPDAEIRQ